MAQRLQVANNRRVATSRTKTADENALSSNANLRSTKAMPLRSAKSSNSLQLNNKRTAFGDLSNKDQLQKTHQSYDQPSKRASSFSDATTYQSNTLRLVKPKSKSNIYNNSHSKLQIYNENDMQQDDKTDEEDEEDYGPPDLDVTDDESVIEEGDEHMNDELDDIDEDDWVTKYVEIPIGIDEVNKVQSEYKEDIDYWDTTMVAEYAPEIFSYMCEQEIETMANPHYMDFQSEIEWSMRATLIDWLLQVHLRYHMLPETLWIAINIIDRFLSVRVVSLVKLQLVGVTAMFIAAKYEEILAPSVDEFVYMTENGYTREEILKGERIILQTLNFGVSSYSSPYTWVRRISKADDYDIQTRTLSKFIMEVALLDHRFIRARPSLIAAVGMYVSRIMLGGEWNEDFVYYSGFAECQLEIPAKFIIEKLTEDDFSDQFCYKKYSNKKFLKASIFARDWAYRSIDKYSD